MNNSTLDDVRSTFEVIFNSLDDKMSPSGPYEDKDRFEVWKCFLTSQVVEQSQIPLFSHGQLYIG